jgi:hypothetical protein
VIERSIHHVVERQRVYGGRSQPLLLAAVLESVFGALVAPFAAAAAVDPLRAAAAAAARCAAGAAPRPHRR